MDVDYKEWVVHPLTGGIVGALLGLKGVPGTSWPARAGNFGLSCAAAAVVTPGLAETLKVSSPAMFALLAVAVGAFGISVCTAILGMIKSIDWAEQAKEFLAWFRSFKKG